MLVKILNFKALCDIHHNRFVNYYIIALKIPLFKFTGYVSELANGEDSVFIKLGWRQIDITFKQTRLVNIKGNHVRVTLVKAIRMQIMYHAIKILRYWEIKVYSKDQQ